MLQVDALDRAAPPHRAPRSAARAPAHASRLYVGYVIGLLSTVHVLSYMDRMALSVMMPHIKADLHLSDGQLGLLLGFAFVLFYATFGIAVGRWADRGVRKNIVATAVALWSVMTALSGAAMNFWQLFAARIGLGIGEAGCIPTSQSIIADYVPPIRRSGVYSIYNLGSVVGTMLGMALAGWLAEVVGWRWAFAALGLPGIALAILVKVTLREPTRGTFDTVTAEPATISLREAIGVLWHTKTYRLLTTYYVVNGFIYAGLVQWYPSFYTRTFGMSSSSVGIYLGLAMGAGSALGLLAGGLIAHKVAQRDMRAPLRVGSVAVALSLPATLGLLLIPSLSGSILLAALSGLLWCVPAGAAAATLYSVTSHRVRATAGSITIACISILGFGLGPACVGLLSDLLVPSFGSHALRYALLLPVCLVPLSAWALHAATRELRHDLK